MNFQGAKRRAARFDLPVYLVCPSVPCALDNKSLFPGDVLTAPDS